MRSSRSKRAAAVRVMRFAIEAIEPRVLLSASFANGVDYSTSAGPSDLVVADLNGDGRPDVATANSSGNSLNVRYGNANGTFSSRTIWPTTGFGPEHVAAGDVDGDGDIDLIAADVFGQYSVFRSSPAGNGFRNFTELTPVDTTTSIFEVELADLDGDAKLDLVITGVNLFIYTGLGDGTFSDTPSVLSLGGGTSGSFAIADLDGVGLPDIVAGVAGSSSTVVRQHRVLVLNNYFPSGGTSDFIDSVPVLPSSVTTGDFNEDGKLDFVVGGFSGGATPTQVIRYHQNDGSGGFTTGVIVFNLPVSPRSVKTADIDGDGNLDVVAITTMGIGGTLVVIPGNGDGTFATTSTTFATGDDPQEIVVADFNGDGKPDVVVANQGDDDFTVHLNNSGSGGPGPAPTAPDLSATIGAVTLPAVFVPGDKGSAQVVIANAGGLARGKVNVELYASTDAALDGADTLLDTGTTLADKSVNIRTDRTARLTGRFVAPATLADGTYFLIAKVTPVDIDGATEATAVSVATSQKVTAFGAVGTRTKVKYAFTDADGTLVTYALSGPGTGTVTTAGSDVTVTLDGTTAASKFTATTKVNRAVPASDNETSIANLTVNGPISSITGKGLQVTNALTVGDVKTIVLEDLIGATADVAVTLSGSTPVALTFDDVHDAIVTSTAAIKSLKADEWFDLGFASDAIAAPWMGKATIEEDFAVALSLSGAGAPNGLALSGVAVGGNLPAKAWAVGGNVGTIAAGGTVDFDWVGNFAGALKSITVKGNFGGDLSASAINSLAVTGDVFASMVRAGGSFGIDNVPETGDDTFAAGTIRKISVKGDVTGSRFWAGADATGAALAGGVLGSVTVAGPVDASTTFVAATLPRTVRIDGETIVVAGDPRFVSLVP